MCRYAEHRYRDHFACFHCRKAFKQWPWVESERGVWDWQRLDRYQPRPVTCPECRRPMADMGLDFKAPHRPARRAWEIMAALHRHGVSLHSCGCGGPGFVPPWRRRAVIGWLRERHRKTAGEALAERFAARSNGH